MVFKFKRSVRLSAKRKRGGYRFRNSRLPEPFKALSRDPEIDIFGEFTEEKRKSLLLSRLSLLRERVSSLFSKLRSAIKRRQKPPVPSAILVGAVCASALSVALAAAMSVLLLFGGYGGSYSEVEIPDLITLSESEAVATDSDIFEYVIEYRSNPDAKVGSVIAQRPAPSVVRRLYSKDKKITLTLTVNREKEQATIPKTVGLSLRDASLMLKNEGLQVRVLNEYSSTAPSGTVIYCSRSAGERVDIDEVIVLTASLGKETVYRQVPNLIGLGESDAVRRLIANRLSAGKISYAPSSAPLGTVIAQEQISGSSVAEGTKISLTVSGGTTFAD